MVPSPHLHKNVLPVTVDVVLVNVTSNGAVQALVGFAVNVGFGKFLINTFFVLAPVQPFKSVTITLIGNKPTAAYE